MQNLNEAEQNILALALFGHAMAAGASEFQPVLDVATKLGVEKRFDAFVKEYQRELRKRQAEGLNVDYILHGEPRSGDSGTIGKELLAGIPEIELKCKAAENAVKDYDFPLLVCLELYGVTEEQYENYLKGKFNA